MTRICTICARGGSKGVAGKNLMTIAGKPLLAWSIDQASASGLFDMVAVSSDSPAILEAARAAGADLMVERPQEMASDTAAKSPAILHCMLAAERHLGRQCDILVDLDATSPLRLAKDIQSVVALLESSGASNVITGALARRSPYFNLVEVSDDGVVALSKRSQKAVVRRQDAPACYDMNASIYAWRREPFVAMPGAFYPDTRLFEMPQDRSVDIDTELDAVIVELLMTRREVGQ